MLADRSQLVKTAHFSGAQGLRPSPGLEVPVFSEEARGPTPRLLVEVWRAPRLRSLHGVRQSAGRGRRRTTR